MSDATATALLETIQQVMRELHPHRADTAAVTLDSSLESELGFDSLGRVELLERLERTFGVRLPDHLLPHAETPRDILRAMPTATSRETAVRPAAMPARSEVADATSTVPTQAQTLIEVLAWHVHLHPERRHMTLYDEQFRAEDISYAELYQGAKTVALGLRQRDLQPRQTVALMLPTSRAFFESFFGILLAGGIPVPRSKP
jgi:acyl carrier protein